ncbi:MAG: NAD(+)/NADH kinase [Anaerotardibacter sp.]
MRVLLVRNTFNSEATDAAFMLASFFNMQGIEFDSYSSEDILSPNVIIDHSVEGGDPHYDLAIVLGGDGTILHTALQIKYARVPILGINFGHLGFMANNKASVLPLVMDALAGELKQEVRTNLHIDVYCEEDFENIPYGKKADFKCPLPEKPSHSFFALNEATLSRGNNGRIIGYSYAVGGEKVADLRGDGLIIATATGSTAYALSAGGPIVSPGFGGLVVVPIAPHTLNSRTLLTEPSDVIEVAMDSSIGNREATLFIDGELIEPKSPIRRLVVRTGEDPTILLRQPNQNFYKTVSKEFFYSGPNLWE